MSIKFLKYLELMSRSVGFGNPGNTYEIITAVIGVLLSMLSVFFLILAVYGGFVWMLSAGEDNKGLGAKKILIQALAGLVIVLSSYALSRFIFESLQELN